MDTSLHRILKALNWSGAIKGVPKDGDVKSKTDPLTGLKSYSLRAQPRAGNIHGVSFFAPSLELSVRVHNKLGMSNFGCMVTSPSVHLHPNLCFVNDIHLELKLDGDDQPATKCGEHWTLYTTADMSTEEFEAAYEKVMKSSIPCNMAGGAESDNNISLQELGVDMDLMPGDRHSYVSVMALDELVASSQDGNVRLFASLFSMHIRATDMGFNDILKCAPITSMAATALDVWTARDPFIEVTAQEAFDMLAGVLDFPLKGIAYKPFWVSSESPLE